MDISTLSYKKLRTKSESTEDIRLIILTKTKEKSMKRKRRVPEYCP